jgi:hypothetical protein
VAPDQIAHFPALAEREAGLILGFERAADALYRITRERLERGEVEAGLLAPPVIFLFRHALELKLKFYIAGLERFLTREPTGTLGHNLPTIWTKYRSLVVEVVPEMAADSRLAIAERFFNELQEDDPESTAFRYATTRSGEPQLKSYQGINIGRFAESAKAIFHFLSNPITIGLTLSEESNSP